MKISTVILLAVAAIAAAHAEQLPSRNLRGDHHQRFAAKMEGAHQWSHMTPHSGAKMEANRRVGDNIGLTAMEAMDDGAIPAGEKADLRNKELTLKQKQREQKMEHMQKMAHKQKMAHEQRMANKQKGLERQNEKEPAMSVEEKEDLDDDDDSDVATSVADKAPRHPNRLPNKSLAMKKKREQKMRQKKRMAQKQKIAQKKKMAHKRKMAHKQRMAHKQNMGHKQKGIELEKEKGPSMPAAEPTMPVEEPEEPVTSVAEPDEPPMSVEEPEEPATSVAEPNEPAMSVEEPEEPAMSVEEKEPSDGDAAIPAVNMAAQREHKHAHHAPRARMEGQYMRFP